jgi:hypothetical protein
VASAGTVEIFCATVIPSATRAEHGVLAVERRLIADA